MKQLIKIVEIFCSWEMRIQFNPYDAGFSLMPHQNISIIHPIWNILDYSGTISHPRDSLKCHIQEDAIMKYPHAPQIHKVQDFMRVYIWMFEPAGDKYNGRVEEMWPQNLILIPHIYCCFIDALGILRWSLPRNNSTSSIKLNQPAHPFW